jgi:hypothetical protein
MLHMEVCPMEQITVFSVVGIVRSPLDKLSTPPIVLVVEAETSKGRLALRVTATALRELLANLQSSGLLADYRLA